MTIQEVYDALVTTREKLESEEVEEDERIDLEILILQLKKQLLIAAFDPLKDLNGITVADVAKLPNLVDRLDAVITKEKKRVELVRKIVTVAKIGLRAAGLPIPI